VHNHLFPSEKARINPVSPDSHLKTEKGMKNDGKPLHF
jgi:hypothetical protein